MPPRHVYNTWRTVAITPSARAQSIAPTCGHIPPKQNQPQDRNDVAGGDGGGDVTMAMVVVGGDGDGGDEDHGGDESI